MASNWTKKIRKSVEHSAAVETQYFDRNPNLGGDPNRIRMREALLETVDNRLVDHQPSIDAYERMITQGISEFDARMFIANIVSREIFYMIKNQQELTEELDLLWLSRLPDLPDD